MTYYEVIFKMCKNKAVLSLLSYISGECEDIVLSGDSAVSICYGGEGIVSNIEMLYSGDMDVLDNCASAIRRWCDDKDCIYTPSRLNTVYVLPGEGVSITFVRKSRSWCSDDVQVIDGIKAIKPSVIIRESCAMALMSPHISSLLYAYKSMYTMLDISDKLLVQAVIRSLWPGLSAYIRGKIYDEVFQVTASRDGAACVAIEYINYEDCGISPDEYITFLMNVKKDCIGEDTKYPFGKSWAINGTEKLMVHVKLKGVL